MLYNVVSVSAIRRHDSATGIHLSPPSGTSLPLPPHPAPLTCHRSFKLDMFQSFDLTPHEIVLNYQNASVLEG